MANGSAYSVRESKLRWALGRLNYELIDAVQSSPGKVRRYAIINKSGNSIVLQDEHPEGMLLSDAETFLKNISFVSAEEQKIIFDEYLAEIDKYDELISYIHKGLFFQIKKNVFNGYKAGVITSRLLSNKKYCETLFIELLIEFFEKVIPKADGDGKLFCSRRVKRPELLDFSYWISTNMSSVVEKWRIRKNTPENGILWQAMLDDLGQNIPYKESSDDNTSGRKQNSLQLEETDETSIEDEHEIEKINQVDGSEFTEHEIKLVDEIILEVKKETKDNYLIYMSGKLLKFILKSGDVCSEMDIFYFTITQVSHSGTPRSEVRSQSRRIVACIQKALESWRAKRKELADEQ